MDDFLRRFEQHVNKPENLRKRHVKIERQIAFHRNHTAHTDRAVFVAERLRDLADVIERHYGANRHRPRHYR